MGWIEQNQTLTLLTWYRPNKKKNPKNSTFIEKYLCSSRTSPAFFSLLRGTD